MDRRRMILLLAIGLAFGSASVLLIGLDQPAVMWGALNIFAALDKVFGSWTVLPPAISWAILGFVVGFLCYFAVWEARNLGHRRGRHWYLVIAGLVLVLSPLAWESIEVALGAPMLWWATEGEHRAGEARSFDDIDFVWVPPGRFLMGSPPGEPGRRENELPHVVVLRQGLWMGKYEITQAQWKAVMGTNPSGFQPGDENRPVENVSIDDCRAFLAKLNGNTARTYRLPTEAEWEYACRAGSSSAYSYGADPAHLDEYGWYARTSEDQTHPVGMKRPNAWDLFDMHGNVLEWCSDWYDFYPDHRVTDPRGASTGVHRVLRGGSWESGAQDCRSAARYIALQDGPLRTRSYGLRIVRPE